MLKQLIVATGVTVALGISGQVAAQSATCADIQWSSAMLTEYPDIRNTCRGVYERDGKLYAKATVELQRVRGNRITFRPVHTDGTKGDSHSVTVPAEFRAKIAGREYRVSQLVRGQELNVYIPEDRFALAMYDETMPEDDTTELVVMDVEDEEDVAMPTTASPLFLFGLAGGALLALGGVFTGLRRRLS